MVQSKKVSNHVTITLTKDEMVYLQRLANLENLGLGVSKSSVSSLCSSVVRHFVFAQQEKKGGK